MMPGAGSRATSLPSDARSLRSSYVIVPPPRPTVPSPMVTTSVPSLSKATSSAKLRVPKCRSARGRCVPLSHDLLPDTGLTARESVRAATAHQERLDDVTDLVIGLPPRQRVILLMHYYARMPVRCIADELGLAPGTVKTTLFQARRRIRERYSSLWEGERNGEHESSTG